MQYSIDESISRLKGEILSQDWRITPARAETLAAALDSLKEEFATRKAALGILAMAQSVLHYIRKQGDQKIPETVDFLKEAMAHLVAFHEEPSKEPTLEKEIFHTVFLRFQAVKQKVTKTRRHTADAAPAQEDHPHSQPNDTEATPPLSMGENAARQLAPATDLTTGDAPVETLVRELKDSLNKAEEVGLTIRQLLSGLNATERTLPPAVQALLKKAFIPSSAPREAPLPPLAPALGPTPPQHAATEASSCPPAPVIPVEIAGRTIAIEQDLIVGRRAITASKKNAYITGGNISLTDFKRFMESLKSQFTGGLSRISNSKLKKLTLPILRPRGIGLSERIDDRVDTMLILESGHWNGILLCTSPGDPEQMTRFQHSPNGDIAGIAHTGNNRYFLLDGAELLKREGFLVV